MIGDVVADVSAKYKNNEFEIINDRRCCC